MKKKANEEAVGEPMEKKRPGRRPMTAAEKAAAAELRAAEKEKANHLKPSVFVQYQSVEVDVSTLEEAAKSEFRSVKKRALVTDLKLYIKPEERMAYYVINGSYEGRIPF